jgi:enoyl-CoA hydratase
MIKSSEAAVSLVTEGSTLARRILSFPPPVIAVCNGHAIAKGAFLLLSCDYRIGTEGAFK